MQYVIVFLFILIAQREDLLAQDWVSQEEFQRGLYRPGPLIARTHNGTSYEEIQIPFMSFSGRRDLSDSTLAILKDLQGLKNLDFSGSNFSELFIGSLPQGLLVLNLCGTAVDSLYGLTQLTSLKSLTINYTAAVQDTEAAKVISRLSLEVLNIHSDKPLSDRWLQLASSGPLKHSLTKIGFSNIDGNPVCPRMFAYFPNLDPYCRGGKNINIFQN